MLLVYCTDARLRGGARLRWNCHLVGGSVELYCMCLQLYSKVTQFMSQVLTPPSKADPNPDH